MVVKLRTESLMPRLKQIRKRKIPWNNYERKRGFTLVMRYEAVEQSGGFWFA